MNFDIDSEMIAETINEALESAGRQASEEQMQKIVQAIDEAMPGVIQVITQQMTEHWRSEAQGAGGWGSKYAEAIKSKVTGSQSEIYIDEEMIDKGSNKPNFMFAMMMEKGVKSWSIKDALMKSEKAKTGSDGIKYIVVPFPVATPRKQGQGKGKSSFGGREMSNEIYKIVKSGGKVPAGTKIGKTDISGLSKYNTRQLHGQYGVFLCISEKSKGWQYPNVPAEPVFPSVLAEVNKQIQQALSAFCQAIVQEFS